MIGNVPNTEKCGVIVIMDISDVGYNDTIRNL